MNEYVTILNKIKYNITKQKGLTNDLINDIKSHSEIADLNECIVQLVNNSIDANAKFIKIQVDFENLNIMICDDGMGMSKKDLKLIGEW